MNYFQYYNDILDRAKAGTLPLEEYDKACSNADWFYYMSDAPLSGHHMDCLREAADHNDDFKLIYNREHARRFNTPSFGWTEDRKYTPPFEISEGALI
jgi:hypothetical protein